MKKSKYSGSDFKVENRIEEKKSLLESWPVWNTDTTFNVISAAFCVVVILSNILSAKMIHLPFFRDLSVPAGLVTYPMAFLFSNLVTETYGKLKAQGMVWMALGMNLLAYALIQLVLVLPSDNSVASQAFQDVMGLGGLRIFASVSAYILSQFLDIQLFSMIGRWTGARFLFLRNNAATWISQMVDTLVIDLIFLYWGLGMEWTQILPIMLFSYLYKAFFAFINTPFLYLFVFMTKKSQERFMKKIVKRSPPDGTEV